MRILLFIIIVLATSCISNDERSSLEEYPTGEMNEVVDVSQWREEILNLDSVFINGSLKVVSHKSEVIKQLGDPKKVTNIKSSKYLSYILDKKPDSFLAPYQMVYDNISFYGIGDQVILSTVDFDHGTSMKSPNLELIYGMNVRQVCNIYPESCKLTLLGGNTWSGHIELRVSKRPIYEDLRWFLTFKNESLIRVELHQFLW